MTKSKYMYGQEHFQTFGLHLSQLLASVQYLLHSAEFAAVLLGLFWGPRWFGGLQNSRTKIISQIGTLKPHGINECFSVS